MCDVQNIAVFCSESIECFPGTVSKFFHNNNNNNPYYLLQLGCYPAAVALPGGSGLTRWQWSYPVVSRYYSSASNYYRYNRTFQVLHSLYLYT